ncbi:MAG: hypothetical protein KAR06_08315, partial [Deltaproteobacteria bacterium]|nr:hypothetical protein [Deltaproteobacteria bacterium]
KDLKGAISKQIVKDLQGIKIKGSTEFEVKDLGANKILKDLRTLEGSSVEVGFPGGEKYKEDPSIDVATLAIIHELGAPKANIDSRPANRMSYSDNLSAIERKSKALYVRVIVQGVPVYKALSELGAWYEGKLKIAYRKGPFKPIKQATINRRRGRSSTPLIDTKTMVNQVQYKVKMGRRGVLA